MADATDAVRRLWGLCSILRDEGVTYHEYLTELTYLLFLKLADELGIEDRIPSEYRWSTLLQTDRNEILDHYQRALHDLGESDDPILQAISSRLPAVPIPMCACYALARMASRCSPAQR
jgi:type I restriction enzyme M protein